MKKVGITFSAVFLGFVVCISGLVPTAARAAVIPLQNGTATFSQLINGGPGHLYSQLYNRYQQHYRHKARSP